MNGVVLVAIGGAFGCVLRYGVNLGSVRLLGSAYPFGTLAVNIVGSFLMGLAIELITRRFDASPELRLVLMTGFLGGFTTFSAFSLDAVVLYERGALVVALLYVVLSVLLSIAALVAGLALARQFA